jgi:hypothetical protein
VKATIGGVVAAILVGVVIALLGYHADHAHHGIAGDREPVRAVIATRRTAVFPDAPLRVPATGYCGVELQAVKTMADPDASRVELRPRPTTIRYLSTQRPSRSGRHGVELQTWRLRATLTGYLLERDSDLHLVLDDGNGRTLIAEIPDPACVKTTSPVLAAIAAARASFLARYDAAKGCFGCLHDRVVVAGVGFYDRKHGQQGLAENGVELHPVVAFRTLSGT